MSASAAPTDPSALLFPAFVYGDHAVCRRKVRAEAKRWAKRYVERSEFPEPKLIPVPPGTVMICAQVEADIIAFGAGAHHPGWFFYLVDYLRMETLANGGHSRDIFTPLFEAFACRYPWGALSIAIEQWNISIPLVTQQFEAVLSFWEQLDTLRYRRYQMYTLADLLLLFHEETIRLWVDAPTGSVKDALRAAMKQMRKASDDEIEMRMMRRLHEIADTDPQLIHREWLKSSGVLEADVANIRATDPDRYAHLQMGHSFPSYLAKLEKKHHGG